MEDPMLDLWLNQYTRIFVFYLTWWITVSNCKYINWEIAGTNDCKREENVTKTVTARIIVYMESKF